MMTPEESELDRRTEDSVNAAVFLLIGYFFAWIPLGLLLRLLGLPEDIQQTVWRFFLWAIYIPGYPIAAYIFHKWIGKHIWNRDDAVT